MDKPAAPDHPIHELLVRRWSPRAFSDHLIEPDKIHSLLEAARWSASSFNEQPWSFLIATRDDEALFSKAVSCLFEANQSWAQTAPLLILTTSKKSFSHNNKPNRVYLHDLGLAIGSLSLQATAMGLALHQMAGVDVEKIRQLYDVPPDHDPITAIAVGYPGDPQQLPPKIREIEQSPRTRKSLSEFVFSGQFDTPAII